MGELKDELQDKHHQNKVSRKIQYIKKIVEMYYGVHHNVWRSKTRKKEYVYIRHVAIYLTYIMTRKDAQKPSLAQIGQKFNGIDHATVLHAKRKIEGYLTYNKDLKGEIDELKTLIEDRTKLDTDQDLMKDHYFIDLNEIISLRLSDQKAVILKGFTEKEAEMFRKAQKIKAAPRLHKNTGAYILEKKNPKK